MQLVLWQVLIYGLGALGLFAIGALPLRTWMLARRLMAQSTPFWLLSILFAAAIGAVVLAGPFLLQLTRCLLGYHCSANAAGGWINVSFLGAIYAGFEIVALIILWVARHRRVAT